MNCTVGVLEGDELLAYSFPPPHPLTSERVKEFWKALANSNIEHKRLSPTKAPIETLELFHTKEYVRFVQSASNLGNVLLDYGDTPAYKGVFEAAQFSVGSTILAVTEIMNGTVDHAFNPVGGLHHARRESAAGFCVFNDVGVAIEVLRNKHELERIVYVDIDVHHGNGVYYSYEDDPNLFIFDIHEDGSYIYPGTGHDYETGKGIAQGTKVNIPLRPGSGDIEVSKELPRLEKFVRTSKPEFIILQCGADGLVDDLLGGLLYTSETHSTVTSLLHRLSHELCQGRIMALGGGGYNIQNCANAWMAVVSSLVHF
jgi:acetoin utilization protein AcuC